MQVANVHDRILTAPVDEVAALLATLGGARDRVWPKDRWPSMRLGGGLAEGSAGGHGPVGYRVTQVEDRVVRFSFLRPDGLHGDHWFEVIPVAGVSVLRHGLVARTTGAMRWQWPLVFRPLHDALIEDALDRAVEAVGGTPERAGWSWRVRTLRRLVATG